VSNEEEIIEEMISQFTVKADNQERSQMFDVIIDQVWHLLEVGFDFIEDASWWTSPIANIKITKCLFFISIKWHL